jgi:hypothetical protein
VTPTTIATPSPTEAVLLPTVSVDPSRYSVAYGDDGDYDIAIQRSFVQGKANLTGEVGISRWYRLTGAPLFTQLVDTFTSAIPDGSSFRISLGCVGTRLTASINGTDVISRDQGVLRQRLPPNSSA